MNLDIEKLKQCSWLTVQKLIKSFRKKQFIPDVKMDCHKRRENRRNGSYMSKNMTGFFFFWVLFIYFLYNIVLVLPYIDMSLPWVYMCSPSWTPLLPPSPSHPSGSSQCTSPEHPVSCIEPGLAICFTYDNIHVSMLFS